MELFCEYTEQLTILAMKAPSQMFDWVMHMPPKILKYEAKVVQIIEIVTMRVSCFALLVVKEKFGQTSKSHNIMTVILEFSSDINFLFFGRKYPFGANLVQQIKIFSLNWNLVSRLIRIFRIQWWCSLSWSQFRYAEILPTGGCQNQKQPPEVFRKKRCF